MVVVVVVVVVVVGGGVALEVIKARPRLRVAEYSPESIPRFVMKKKAHLDVARACEEICDVDMPR